MIQYSQYQSVKEPKSFVLLGDTQRTMGYQKLMGRERNNHKERLTLLYEIHQLKPDFIILLGDLVTFGHSSLDWGYFHSVMVPLRALNIPIIPILGNHDYFLFPPKARKNIQSYFPSLIEKSWQSFIWNKTGFILLDSNRLVLGLKKWNEQLAWLSEIVEEFEKNPRVESILMMGHHPPFTNSFEIRPHKPTSQFFLPHFFVSSKTKAYFSGHCHAYERFSVNDKTFIVSGGGGGPRQPLMTGFFKRFQDLYPGNRFRPFHYIYCTPHENGLSLEVRGLEKGQSKTFQMETVLIS